MTTKRKKEHIYLIGFIIVDILLMISLFHAYNIETNARTICDDIYKPLVDYYNENNNQYYNIELYLNEETPNQTNKVGLYKELNEDGTLSETIYTREEIGGPTK